MLTFSPWRIAFILGVCLLGVWMALPNLFSDEQLDAMPGWMPKDRINLGLDLQGGVHLLLEVDVDEVTNQQLEQLRGTISETLEDAGVRRHSRAAVEDDAVTVTITSARDVDKAREALQDEAAPVQTA